MRFAAEIPANGQRAQQLTDAENLPQGFEPRGRVFGCADPECLATLYHRAASMTEGHTLRRAAHFATFGTSAAHRDDCTAYERSAEQADQLTMKKALAEGKHVLINLDFRARGGLGDVFTPAARGLSPYNRFRRDHEYATIAAANVHDVLRHRRVLLESGIKDATARAMVGYHGQIMGLDDVCIENDRKALATLFENMVCGRESVPSLLPAAYAGSRTKVAGFPRLFNFEPKKLEYSQPRACRVVDGCKIPYRGGLGNFEFILMQRLHLPRVADRARFITPYTSHVLAIPVVDVADSKKAAARYRMHSGPQFTHMEWHIAGDYQYTPDETRPVKWAKARQAQMNFG